MNNFILKTIKFLLCALPLVSIVVADSMFFPFITGKVFLFRVGIEFIFCLYVALAFADPHYRPKKNNLLIAFTAFMAVIFVADIFAFDSAKAFFSNFERMEGFVLLAHLFAYFVVLTNVLKEKKDWSIMIASSVGVSVFMTFFAYLQLFGGAVINQGGIRLDGTLGNSAYMATYMMFHIFFLIYLWFSNGNKVKGIGDAVIGGSALYIVYYLYELSIKNITFGTTGGVVLAIVVLSLLKACWFRFSDDLKKYEAIYTVPLYFVLIFAEIIILYYTATRGAMLGLMGGLLLAAIIIIFTEKENKLIRNGAIALVSGIIILVLAFIAFKDTDFVKKSSVLSRFASISINDTKTQARTIIWPIALDAIKEKPVFGWGQDNFIFAFAKYYRPEMIRHEPWFDSTHDVFLDWFVAGGILGFLGYLSLYILAFIALLKSKAFNRREKAVLVGLFSAYTFQNIFIFDTLSSYMLFMLILGLLNLDIEGHHRKHTAERIESPLLSAVFVVFVIVLLVINYRPYEQNITLSQGINQQKEGVAKNLSLLQQALAYGSTGEFETVEQMDRLAMEILSSDKVSDQDKNDFGLATLKILQDEKEKHPGDVRTYINLGTFLTDVGMYNDAIPFLEKAKDLSPKKQQISFALAKAYLLKGDKDKDQTYTDKALATLKYAYELAPEFDVPKLVYAQSLAVTGHIDEAVVLAKTMDSPEDFAKPNIVKLLVEKGHANDAIAILELAIKVDPGNNTLYTLISDIYTFEKNKVKAIEWLKAMEVAIPSSTAEAEQDIQKVNAVLK